MERHYTTIEQSKKLLELGLSPRSADMVYWINRKDCTIPWEEAAKDEKNVMIYIRPFGGGSLSGYALPCWSVGALLELLPEIQGGKPIISLDDNYITYPHMSDLHTKADNLVDACVAMIERLHELKML